MKNITNALFICFLAVTSLIYLMRGLDNGTNLSLRQQQEAGDDFDSFDTAKIIEKGRNCYTAADKTWSCLYKVGESVDFKISFDGTTHKVFLRNRGDETGDFFILLENHYYLSSNPDRISFFTNSYCLPVGAGAKTLGTDYLLVIYSRLAYVSLADGRVFPEEDLCTDMMEASLKKGGFRP